MRRNTGQQERAWERTKPKGGKAVEAEASNDGSHEASNRHEPMKSCEIAKSSWLSCTATFQSYSRAVHTGNGTGLARPRVRDGLGDVPRCVWESSNLTTSLLYLGPSLVAV
jgi:hypothetical protein